MLFADSVAIGVNVNTIKIVKFFIIVNILCYKFNYIMYNDQELNFVPIWTLEKNPVKENYSTVMEWFSNGVKKHYKS